MMIVWRRPQCFFDVVPSTLRPWLAMSGSMTQGLRATLPAPLQVEATVLRHQHPDMTERHALDLGVHTTVDVRLARLHGGGDIEVWARTAFPPQTRCSALTQLRDSCKPLGQRLFYDRAWRRTAFVWGRLKPGDVRQLLGRCSVKALWARRSCWRRRGAAIVITEAFCESV